MGVVLCPIVIPWPYVFANYVRAAATLAMNLVRSRGDMRNLVRGPTRFKACAKINP